MIQEKTERSEKKVRRPKNKVLNSVKRETKLAREKNKLEKKN